MLFPDAEGPLRIISFDVMTIIITQNKKHSVFTKCLCLALLTGHELCAIYVQSIQASYSIINEESVRLSTTDVASLSSLRV